MAIGIIGLGRLGGALARGLARAGVRDVWGFNRTSGRAREVAAQAPGLTLLPSAGEVLERCDPVFLWMKGDDAIEVLGAHRELVARRAPLVVTCTPGVPVAEHTRRWAETLPSVSLCTGQGATLLAWGPELSEADRERVRGLLRACGAVHELPRAELTFYAALTSCGPALYARMMEVWADALSARRGYDREACRAMVRQTLAGTLALQEQDGIDAAEVIRRVAHPGGSTIKGLVVLDRLFPALAEEMLRAMGKL
jgi:pyrroline-5-carboxylate reductase